MSRLTILGIVLLVLGLLGLVIPGISYTKREQILKVGPIEATAHVKKTVLIPPIVCWIAVVAGGAILVAGILKKPGA
ncbi:MAG: DUF3185 domain-containing protein [Verrucomicrobiales bacterium]